MFVPFVQDALEWGVCEGGPSQVDVFRRLFRGVGDVSSLLCALANHAYGCG